MADHVGEVKVLNHVGPWIAQAKLDAALTVLALVPDRTPMEGDVLPG